MGAVYHAWDTRLNAPVAIKEMVPQSNLGADTLSQLRQQFRQEAAVLARLDHPHLVGVSDFFEEGANAYLVMKFIEGESLFDRIQREGAQTEPQVLVWMDQLLDALAYCHDQGIIHRDIKPQNVIIRPDGRVVLVDFGLFKRWDPDNPHTQTVMRGMGTPEYAPPEQYGGDGRHTDARSDIYSLGATLYHALTGVAPPAATMRIADPQMLKPIREISPRVSSHLESVLLQALNLRPEMRFRSTRAMRAALDETPTMLLPGEGDLGRGGEESQGRSIPRWAIGLVAGLAVLALVVCIGVVLGARYLSRDESVTPPAVAEGGLQTATLQALTPVSRATAATLPASTPVPEVTPEPTATSIPEPTPVPTDLPTSTPIPSPTCPAVTGAFSGVWSTLQEQLGCPVNAVHTTWMAVENFEQGQMFWREDTDVVIVLYSSGYWGSYINIWQEGDPTFSCPDSAPQESPPTPLRGFGKIWCNFSDVRNGLGWATGAERGFHATVQDFERGIVFRTDNAETYVLYGDRTWNRW
jgi:serine/threonine-protein kinase